MLKTKAVLIIDDKLIRDEIREVIPYETSKHEEDAIINEFWETYDKKALYSHLQNMVCDLLHNIKEIK